jgi:predicted ATP-grasp superfamily ATP-dependent carboligase
MPSVNPSSREKSPSAPVPALVLGGTVTALGTIRSLGPLGIPVYSTCPADDVAAQSRWARVLDGGLTEFSTPEQLAAYLSRAPFERMVLIPCSDAWAETVAALPSDCGARFPSFVSPFTVLRELNDKESFAGLVRRLQIPHPQTLFVHSESDLDGVELAPGTQFFLKARNSQQFIARTGVKAYMVSSPGEIRRRIAELSAAGLGVVLQEYIPGPPTNHYFVDGFADGQGRILARFARQRQRMHPPHFGNSTFLRSVALADVADIVETVDRLIAGCGLRGIFSVELKRDANTGIAKVLEVNARAWWYVHYATACGVNVCEMTYRAALGESVEPHDGRYRVGRTCVYVRPDLRACRDLRRQGKLSLLSCVPDWLGGEHMIFSVSDPMPFLYRLYRETGTALRRLVGG